MDPVVVYVRRLVQSGSESLVLNAPEDFDVGIGAEFHRSIWVWVLLCIGGVCFLLIVLIFRRFNIWRWSVRYRMSCHTYLVSRVCISRKWVGLRYNESICLYEYYSGLEAVTVAILKSAILWDMTPYSSVNLHRRFTGTLTKFCSAARRQEGAYPLWASLITMYSGNMDRQGKRPTTDVVSSHLWDGTENGNLLLCMVFTERHY
jgi:hypothetical protein